ncbi:MAG: FAD-dependent oxidoreductase [Phormidesmis sp.]
MDILTADVLVVGGGTGGVAAAIQAARRGASVVLVSELPWLGGMLTAAGVCAPDGNELAAFQTGLWGAFLQALRSRHPAGLDNGWVSFFTYDPAVGAQIFADWVAALPNLKWIVGERSREVLRASPAHGSDCIIGVRFEQITVQATITIDATELGDLLALAEVPYRWGWETKAEWNEPSAPVSLSDPTDPLYAITQCYPVQSPTWVVIVEDYGEAKAPVIEAPPNASPDSCFEGAWANYGDADTPAGQMCLNYGRLPDNRFMINWPHRGNDYGVGLQRLIESDAARAQYGREARWHSQSFARYLQRRVGKRYGLAYELFPQTKSSPGGAFALMPYYRESRRLVGLSTVSEGDILPIAGAQVAALPVNADGDMSAIAFGNYPNDHHYPGFEMPLAPKAIRWGGRWTGTPFTIPYEALVPKAVDGLLVCEKNISVSHIANGATRLQPVVLGIGQAAGMAAALCIEQGCWPRDLAENGRVRSLQTALISDPSAPAAIIPLFNVDPHHPQWQSIQQHYLTHPESYPLNGYHAFSNRDDANLPAANPNPTHADSHTLQLSIQGEFLHKAKGQYELFQTTSNELPNRLTLVTVRSEVAALFLKMPSHQQVHLLGRWNAAGKWLICEQIQSL